MTDPDYLGIILNEEVLRESHIPERLPGRSQQIENLRECLKPLVSKCKPYHAWVYGAPGSGKTSTVKFVLSRLYEEVGVRSIYVDCSMNQTFHSVLSSILLSSGWVNTENNSASKLSTLKRFLDGKPLIVVLDEVQQMRGTQFERALGKLAEIESLGLICISYSREKFMFMPERLRDKIRPKLIPFLRYSVADVMHILEERSVAALVQSCWSSSVLEEIAQVAKGSARVAIQTLRVSAQEAERQSASSIESKHIALAHKNTLLELRAGAEKRLNEHQLILYEAIKAAGKIQSKPLREDYLKRCHDQGKNPMGERAIDGCLRELRYMKLIMRRREAVKGKVYTYSLE